MLRMRSRLMIAFAAALLLPVAGCSGLLGASGAATTGGSLEQTTLNVAVVPAVDSAGFFVALHDGLFAKAGLTIRYTPATSSDTVIDQQVNGVYDITAGNYVSYVQHAAISHQPLQIVAEGSVMLPGSQAIYTMPGSRITSLEQLEGHLLGINAPGNINYLLTAAVLTENGVSLGKVRFPAKPIPFPEMAGQLAAGKVDAAALPEPFATIAEEVYGAVPLADLNQGATANFPILGYVTTRAWASSHPHTLHAFISALEEGQQISDTSRSAVEQAMEVLHGPQQGQVPPIIAAVMSLDTYPIGIDPTRLQRVPDVMLQYGLLHSRFNIGQLLGG